MNTDLQPEHKDLHYLAGVLAHRGHIGFNICGVPKVGGYYRYFYPAIRVSTSDEELARGLKQTFGGSVFPRRGQKKPHWVWHLCNRQAEYAAIRLIPYMLNPTKAAALARIIDWYRFPTNRRYEAKKT